LFTQVVNLDQQVSTLFSASGH